MLMPKQIGGQSLYANRCARGLRNNAPITTVIERFHRLIYNDRRTYADMLAILMDSHERRS